MSFFCLFSSSKLSACRIPKESGTVFADSGHRHPWAGPLNHAMRLGNHSPDGPSPVRRRFLLLAYPFNGTSSQSLRFGCCVLCPRFPALGIPGVIPRRQTFFSIIVPRLAPHAAVQQTAGSFSSENNTRRRRICPVRFMLSSLSSDAVNKDQGVETGPTPKVLPSLLSCFSTYQAPEAPQVSSPRHLPPYGTVSRSSTLAAVDAACHTPARNECRSSQQLDDELSMPACVQAKRAEIFTHQAPTGACCGRFCQASKLRPRGMTLS